MVRSTSDCHLWESKEVPAPRDAAVLYVTHPIFSQHQTGPFHPERTARLRAVEHGVHDAGVPIRELSAPKADREMLELVHVPAYLDAIQRFCEAGGGHLDPDTVVVPTSWEAALRAAGAGPAAVAEISASDDLSIAFLSLRPPGHHATPDRAMGFCLINNVGVTAGLLASQGARVAIIDWDVHHGNGTQAMFYTHPGVLYISLHQFPFYPYEGRAEEVGEGPGLGTTVNIPVPAGTAGDVYRMAWNEIISPVLIEYDPEWLLVSAGYDAHSEDPLAELRLESSDFGWMASRLALIRDNKPVLLFLEGGYHLPALTTSVASSLRGLFGETPQPGTEFLSSDEGFRSVDRAKAVAGRFWSL